MSETIGRQSIGKASEGRRSRRWTLEEVLKALESQIDEGKTKLSRLVEASEDAWESIKDGVESAWDSLQSAVRDAAAKFKE